MYLISQTKPNTSLLSILHHTPDAVAHIKGSDAYPCITGTVKLYETCSGVLVYTEVKGLPASGLGRIFGYHIHEGEACCGDNQDPFSAALTHYNPTEQIHPYHSGDLPPLFGNHGFALSMVLTDRFSVREVIGKVIIIHDSPDDFTSQPSGNSGTKIACGVITSCCQCA